MDPNAKQLAVEKLKSASSVLITVSANPSVDDLSAAIGLSLLMGKLGKHASAVFSGQIPPAIQFLEPDKRFEHDVAGLRDFIIALDKEKADKLRYKVEDNMVKIFITPYKTRITKDDLSFSEGDFNVDAVVALNVGRREDLDNAIKSHGRILHDAAVITIGNSGGSNLGSIDWQDPAASSLSEMLVSISESFGSGLLDQQMSTAFLTGIVAATQRFSNNKTSPKVMTMAAQLMAAGANQQLISDNLATIMPQGKPAKTPPSEDPSQLRIEHDDRPLSQPQPPDVKPQPPAEPMLPAPSTTPLPPAAPPPPPPPSLKQVEDEIANLASPSPSQVIKPSPMPPPQPKSQPTPIIGHPKGHSQRDVDENPILGGTFNATSEKAHEDTLSDLKGKLNNTVLHHEAQRTRLPDVTEPSESVSTSPLDPLTPGFKGLVEHQSETPALDNRPVKAPSEVSAPAFTMPAPGTIDVDTARREVEDALSSQPFNPAGNPIQSIGAQPLPTDTDIPKDVPPPPSTLNPPTTTNPAQQFTIPGQK